MEKMEDYSFAYLGNLVNDEGDQYAVVYDKTMLNFFDQDELRNRFAGDVWNQVLFMTSHEYYMNLYPNTHKRR